MIKELCFKSYTILQHFRNNHFIPTVPPTFLTLSFFGFYNNSKPKRKTDRYWLIDGIPNLLEEADRLYCEENYIEVYEILNRLKYQDNVEVQWRICRVLLKMASDENKEIPVKQSMIEEAYNLIIKIAELNKTHSEVQKWMAIILDEKSALEGILARLQAAPIVHKHMIQAQEHNPEDPAVLYMLGIWCYQISKLTWIQTQIATYLLQCPPQPTSTEEAYRYFLKAEQFKPRFFVGNIYMLGLCSYDLGMNYRARYYLKIAAELPVRSDLERKYSEEARKLAEKLEDYEVNVVFMPLS